MSSKRLRVPWGGSTSRRTALRLGASGLAVGVAGRALPAAAAQAEPATFVLVPGQWTGAFIWHSVTPLLRAAGHLLMLCFCRVASCGSLIRSATSSKKVVRPR